MPDLPTGTVTFLFTDLEGSTRLWEDHAEAMRRAVARHDELLRQAIASHGGHVFKTGGDAFCAVFGRAPDALAAALEAQLALAEVSWEGVGQLRARMALHAGTAEERDGDYFGPALNRTARLAIGHGGQTLLTRTVHDLVVDAQLAETALRDLGKHRLRDLQRHEEVFQLVHSALPSEFPPLRSLESVPHNLPLQLTSFVGRERELAELERLLRRTRLLTLTGAGGSGKTRLALQAAAEVVQDFPDGVWFVDLAVLADPGLVPQTVASALRLREARGRALSETLPESLKERKLLLVLDNCEHLVEACADLAGTLLRVCPQLALLTTSREALAVAGELVWQVPPSRRPIPTSSHPGRSTAPRSSSGTRRCGCSWNAPASATRASR